MRSEVFQHINVGKLRRRDRDIEAEPVLRELVALNPTNAMAQEMLAVVFANTGRFAEARDRYERAIDAAAKLAGSYYDIKTPSKWQARQPIHSGAIESWGRYEPWLGPLGALVP